MLQNKRFGFFRRQIDAHHIGLLVHQVIDEAGVLVAEAVVILPPDV